jgi:outer membrane protein assembly factor BamB
MKKGIIVGLSVLAISVQAQQNIQWRNDRTGIYHEQGLMKQWPADGPQMLWHYDGLGEGHTSVAIDADKLYITGLTDGKGYIYVFDLAGKLLNKKEYGAEWAESYNGPRGTITVNGGKLYLISGMGEIYCFDQNSLNLVWKKDLLKEYSSKNIKWGINEAPLIIGDKVIATPGGKTGNMVALNKNTGALVWSSPGAGDLSAYCSPLYISDQQVPIIVTMTADHIIGVNADNGTFLWSHPNKNQYSVHANTPVYGDGMILCTSGYGRGSTMLRLTNGGRGVEEVWFNKELDNRIGAMVKVGDYAYGSGDSNRYWFCVDWKTGEIKWKERGLAMGNIISNDGLLYYYTDRGNILLVKASPEKQEIISRFAVRMGTEQHWAHPVLYKGVMYVRHGNTLMAHKVK